MTFPKDFLDLQLSFAKRVSEVSATPLNQALFDVTSLPIRFGMAFTELNTSNPIWIEFLSRVTAKHPLIEVIYDYHLERMQAAPPLRPQFGCFSYDDLQPEKGIKLHFANNDTPEPGVLSPERVPVRLKELKTMFTQVKQQHPDYEFVISSSWLFNLNSFRKLFPREFTARLQIKSNDYRSLGLWGQFLDKYNHVKPDLIEEFSKKINASNNLEELADSFPLKELKAECEIKYFYRDYAI